MWYALLERNTADSKYKDMLQARRVFPVSLLIMHLLYN